MTLENKYNVSRETLTQMAKDGVISCSVLRHYEILDIFNRLKNDKPTRSNYDIFCQMASELRLSTDTIDKIVYNLRKK